MILSSEEANTHKSNWKLQSKFIIDYDNLHELERGMQEYIHEYKHTVFTLQNFQLNIENVLYYELITTDISNPILRWLLTENELRKHLHYLSDSLERFVSIDE